jgi:hypothetical protein
MGMDRDTELETLIRAQAADHRDGSFQRPERGVIRLTDVTLALASPGEQVLTVERVNRDGRHKLLTQGCPIHRHRFMYEDSRMLWRCGACDRERQRIFRRTHGIPEKKAGCQVHGLMYWTGTDTGKPRCGPCERRRNRGYYQKHREKRIAAEARRREARRAAQGGN